LFRAGEFRPTRKQCIKVPEAAPTRRKICEASGSTGSKPEDINHPRARFLRPAEENRARELYQHYPDCGAYSVWGPGCPLSDFGKQAAASDHGVEACLHFPPGLGLVIYILFGRDTKAFAKQSKLLRQNLEANAKPLLSAILCRQDTEIARLEHDSASRKKLMMLVRQNSQSALTRRNTVEILQNAETFYPR
jgi:hypothetical protein